MLTKGRQLRQLINRLPCVKSQPSSLKAGREQSLSFVAASMSERPGPETDDERRRYYRLTSLGRRVAMAEAELLARLVEVAREKKLLGDRRIEDFGMRISD